MKTTRKVLSSKRRSHLPRVLVCLLFLITAMSGNAQGENWRKITEMPNPRYAAGTCVLDGKIYVIGGTYTTKQSAEHADYHYVAMVNTFDPETGVWDTLAPLETPRCYIQAVVVDRKIYAIGGTEDIYGESSAKIEVFDVDNKRWDRLDDMPAKRCLLGACVLNDQIYVAGGIKSFATLGNPLKSMDKFDPVTGLWESCAAMPRGTSGFTTVSYGGLIYAIGGGVFGSDREGFVEAYDPDEDSWTRKSSLSGGRLLHGACLANGMFYVAGGMDRTYPPNLASTEVFNQTTDTWFPAQEEDFLPIKLSDLSMLTLDKKIYAFGGCLEGPIHWVVPDFIELDFPVVRVRNGPELSQNDSLLLEFYEEGTLYIVPEGTPAIKDSILESQLEKYEGEAHQMITIPLANLPKGNYEVFGIASDDRLDHGSSPFQLDFVEGIDQLKSRMVSISPNPFNNLITIQTSLPGEYTIEIYNVNGQLIRESTFTGSSHQVDLSNLSRGIYITKVSSGDFTTTQKLIKE